MEPELPIKSNTKTGDLYIAAIQHSRTPKGCCNTTDLSKEFTDERERRIRIMMKRAKKDEPLNGGM